MLSRSRTAPAFSLLDQPSTVWSDMASPTVLNASMDCALSIDEDLGFPASGDKFKMLMHAFAGACPWEMVLPVATIALLLFCAVFRLRAVLSVFFGFGCPASLAYF